MMDALAFLVFLWAIGAVISLPGVAAIAVISISYTIFWCFRRQRHPFERNLAGKKVKAGIIVSSILIIQLSAIGVVLLLGP